jgi:hypothetical protein
MIILCAYSKQGTSAESQEYFKFKDQIERKNSGSFMKITIKLSEKDFLVSINTIFI